MTAAVKIYEMTATKAGTDKTSSTVRFKLADDQTVDTNNPITIPSGGDDYNWSYTKQLRMYCATAPDTQIDNFGMYTDGSNTFGTGIAVNASNTLADGGSWSANATPAMVGGADIFGYDSGSPFDMDAQHTGAVSATGFFGDIARLQMVVASTASSGTLSAETVTFVYDEV